MRHGEKYKDYPDAIFANIKFVVLNKHTLSMFENTNVNSLDLTIDVSNIAIPRIPKAYIDGGPCF